MHCSWSLHSVVLKLSQCCQSPLFLPSLPPSPSRRVSDRLHRLRGGGRGASSHRAVRICEGHRRGRQMVAGHPMKCSSLPVQLIGYAAHCLCSCVRMQFTACAAGCACSSLPVQLGAHAAHRLCSWVHSQWVQIRTIQNSCSAIVFSFNLSRLPRVSDLNLVCLVLSARSCSSGWQALSSACLRCQPPRDVSMCTAYTVCNA